MASPFHAGEHELQARTGMRDKIEAVGARIVRDTMPDQHRELFGKLPMLVIGAVDASGRPHASIVAGPPGFVTTPDARTIAVAAGFVPGDPIDACVMPGAPVGVLGIELATRRRNRANGTVIARGDGGFAIQVDQSFGNCPQYIQARTARLVERAAPSATPEHARLSPRAAALLTAADTWFIASASARPGAGPPEGVDVSHRGGNPGFVRISDDEHGSVLSWPDYRGNFMFNTLGNLSVNPRAGIAALDFATGDLLTLDGTTELVWDDAALAGFPGAQRLVRLRVRAGALLAGAIPLAWTAPVPAPQLAEL